MNDLLWADPMQDEDNPLTSEQIFNSSRGSSVKFGWPLLKKLLEAENLKGVLRGHEEQYEGFKFNMWNGEKNDPPCITVFSVPHYCGHNNRGAVFSINPSTKNIMKTYAKAEYQMHHIGNARKVGLDNGITFFFRCLELDLREIVETVIYFIKYSGEEESESATPDLPQPTLKEMLSGDFNALLQKHSQFLGKDE